MILVIDCGSTYIKELPKLLESFKFKLVSFNNLDNISFKDFKGIIISGAPILLTKGDKESYLKKFTFLNKINLPVLGICFGHQIIGLLSNATIHMGEEIRYKQEINVIEEDDLFKGLTDFVFVEDHCEYITLPEEFTLLAKSKTCKNEAMKHKTKPIYSTQFHPEVSGENGKILLKNFINICKK
jgi:GMP synthase (glutamine-hydrolysing)